MTLRKLAWMKDGVERARWMREAQLTAPLLAALSGKPVDFRELMPECYQPPVRALPPSQW